EEKYLSEQSMTKKELLNVIHTLIGSLNENNQPQFKNLSSKKKDDLLLILQQVKDLNDDVDESEGTILTETNIK
ncbi:10679_t:CDS:1, partial [Entrophospora sp. SA101]